MDENFSNMQIGSFMAIASDECIDKQPFNFDCTSEKYYFEE
jgi:hypothetical protein